MSGKKKLYYPMTVFPWSSVQYADTGEQISLAPSVKADGVVLFYEDKAMAEECHPESKIGVWEVQSP